MPNRWSVDAAQAARPLALALDVGTSSVRIGLHDARGRPLGGTLRRSRHRWTTSTDGGVTIDPDELLERIEGLVDRLVDETEPALLGDVRVAGISTLYHSFVGVDDERRPLTALLSWADTSAEAEAGRLAAELDPDEVWQRTGAPLHAGYWPARIRHLTRTQPGLKIAGWAGLPELLLERLTGCWTIGLSLASGTGLVERAGRRWSPLLLDAVGIDEGSLPTITASLAPVGRLAGPSAARWPALVHVEWLPPIGDGTCGNVGLGCIGPARAALMVGTSAALRVLVEEVPRPLPRGLFAYPVETGHTLLGGALSEGGGVAAWWSRFVGRSLAELTGEAAGRPAGQVTILPYLTGERGPGYHDEARGVIAGLDRGADPASVFRAVLESVALGLTEIDERLSAALAGAPAVVASGGGVARSTLWQQILADAIGRPIAVAGTSEPSLRGAALFALAAIGEVPLGTAEPPPTSSAEPDAEGRRQMIVARRRRDELYRRLLT